MTSKFTIQSNVQENLAILSGDVMGIDPTALKKPDLGSNDEVEQIKSVFKELKSKG